MLYRNEDQAFFSLVDSSYGERVISVVKYNEALKLRTSQAHSIYKGDRFAMFSPGLIEGSYAEEYFATVTYARPLTSDFDLGQRDVRI